MPESRLGLVTSLPGGLIGGVIGPSFVGLPVLPLSSVVIPAPPDPDADSVASDPVATVSSMVELDSGAAGEDVDGVSLTLKRDFCGGAVRGSGADCRYREGDEYEYA